MRQNLALSLCLLCPTMLLGAAQEAPDIVIADFEGSTYGDWKVTGEAFGPGPAEGTLPNQMPVSGFLGKRLVNSYFKGDDTTGTLTSPKFRIERPYICFLIGGGLFPRTACINLNVEGKTVRSATGPNDRAGGTERLDWFTWDVADLAGKEASLEIVDQQRGGWGHINIDQIIQSSQKHGAEPAERELVIEKRYLLMPVKSGGSKCWLQLQKDNQCVREFEIELAEAEADFQVPVEVTEFKGQKLKIHIDRLPFGSKGLPSISQADELPDAKTIYREPLRPQFHFTSKRGWHNDPNGLVYYKGDYHLFYQHNPYGTAWGNMTWGHAISKDMVHWVEIGDAIYPDKLGTVFSGSAIVDWKNTSGWKTGDDDPIVCIYTAAGELARPQVPFTQAIAYSADRGRTWPKYPGNPVLGNIIGSNRDPKVFWHEPTSKWIMALFLDGEQYALFTSQDLKKWDRLCDIPTPGGSECPDMFELPVDGNTNQRKWVFWAANGNYLIGTFDGTSFKKESGPHVSRYGRNDYAAQTYSDIPQEDGRRIQISWMAGGQYPKMPFNQQMTVPRVLTLRTTPEGVRLFTEPVRELESLRKDNHALADKPLVPGNNLLQGLSGDLLDIDAEIEVGKASKILLEVRGTKIEYAVKEQQLSALEAKAPLVPENGRIRLRVLVDRTSVEIFANQGRIQMASCFVPDPDKLSLGLNAEGGEAKVVKLNVWKLSSIWH